MALEDSSSGLSASGNSVQSFDGGRKGVLREHIAVVHEADGNSAGRFAAHAERAAEDIAPTHHEVILGDAGASRRR